MVKKKVNRLFGVKLDPLKTTVPDFLEGWLNELENKGGLETEGIFRISGSLNQIKKLKELVEEGDGVDLADYSIHDVAGLTKMYFRELPEPLFTSDLYACFVAAGASKNVDEIKQALDLLPVGHRVVLNRLLSFLRKVVDHSNVNKMVPENLATCLVPNLLRPRNESVEVTIVDYPFQIMLFALIIENYEVMFKKDIEEIQKKKDAMKEKALQYKKMMEQKYKKAAEPKENKDSRESSAEELVSEPVRAPLKRMETKEDLDFKLSMHQKYQRIKASNSKRLEHQRESRSAMEFKAMLEDQFQRIQSGEITPTEVRELIQVSLPPEITETPPPVEIKPNLRKIGQPLYTMTLPPPVPARHSFDTSDVAVNKKLDSPKTVEAQGRNRSWTAFENTGEPNTTEITDILRTLPSLDLPEKPIPKQSQKPPPRPPRNPATIRPSS